MARSRPGGKRPIRIRTGWIPSAEPRLRSLKMLCRIAMQASRLRSRICLNGILLLAKTCPNGRSEVGSKSSDFTLIRILARCWNPRNSTRQTSCFFCTLPHGKHHKKDVHCRTANIMFFCTLPHGKHHVFSVPRIRGKLLTPYGGNSTEFSLALRHARTVGNQLKSCWFPLPSIT